MENVRVIVLSGQSNGCGVARYKLLKDRISDERYDSFFKGFSNVKIRRWSHGLTNENFENVRLFDGFSSCDVPDCFGPELGFAEYLSKKINEEIYIIKWAFGGASLDFDFASPSSNKEYFEGSIHGDHYGWCFEGLVKLVSESLDILKKEGKNPIIESFMWMQGESDACDQVIDRYENKMNGLLNDFKNKFNDNISPDFTFIDAGICEHSGVWPLAKEMNLLKTKISKNLPSGIFMDTEKAGLETLLEPFEGPDIYHYDSLSMLKLGEMFGEAYLNKFFKNN